MIGKMKTNARPFFLFICISMLTSIEAEHFQGGTITYKILNKTGSNISISLTQTYIFTHASYNCTDTAIAEQLPISGINTKYQCDEYCDQSGVRKSVQSSFHCIDYSTNLDISVIQHSDVINIGDASCCLVTYQDEDWRELSLPNGIGITGNWSVLCRMDLRPRSNGRFNNPPVATMISPIYIPVGIPQHIFISTIDADNDQVRCRFAKGPLECADVCHPDSLPIGTTIDPNCILSITGASASDWYAVAIMVRKQSLLVCINCCLRNDKWAVCFL
jgi:hypothetical protein